MERITTEALAQKFIEEQVAAVREQVKDGKVLLALSGGVDSSVVAALLIKAIGQNLVCVHVNHGFLRKGEPEQVIEVFRNQMNANLIYVDAADRFIDKVAGVTDPEEKRHIIGEEFIKVFDEEAAKLSGIGYLAQGTIYPDILESEKGIKAHKKSYFKKQDDYKPFLGTYYQELKDETLGNNPDTVHVYVPNGTNESKSVTKDGVEFDSQVIKDDTFDEANKYMAFLGGDQRLTTIVNDAVEDDSACVLLCDSYGNAFAPFLVDHYHTVYVKDFRYTDPNIVDFCVQNNVTDLIVLNTMKISSAKSTLAQLQIDLLGQ